MRNVLDILLEKIKAHILRSITFFSRKSCPLRDNVEIFLLEADRTQMTTQYGACVLPTEYVRIHTHALCLRILLFNGNNIFANTPQCYVLRTEPHLLALPPFLHTSSQRHA